MTSNSGLCRLQAHRRRVRVTVGTRPKTRADRLETARLQRLGQVHRESRQRLAKRGGELPEGPRPREHRGDRPARGSWQGSCPDRRDKAGPNDAGLAAAARTRDQQEVAPPGDLADALHEPVDQGLPAEEVAAVQLVEGPQALVRVADRPARYRCVQPWVLGEDPALEAAELRPGIDPQLVGEDGPSVCIDAQRLRLASGTVQRGHQLGAGPLAEGMLVDQRPQRLDHIGVATERQVGVDGVLERPQAQLLESRDLGPRERLVGDLRVRRAAPFGQRSREAATGSLRVGGQERAALGGQALEPGCVQSVRVDPQQVATGLGRQHLAVAARLTGARPARRQRVAQTRDVERDGLRAGVGRVVAPELVDDPVRGDHPVGMDQEQGEQRHLATGGHLEPFVALERLDLAQDAELHGTSHPGVPML